MDEAVAAAAAEVVGRSSGSRTHSVPHSVYSFLSTGLMLTLGP